MWHYVDAPRTMRVTTALAKQFAEMTPCPHDRPLDERRKDDVKRWAREGCHTLNWAIGLVAGKEYRVNGKHTATAFNELEDVPLCYVTVEKFFCADLADLAQLYAAFDTRKSARTTGDINYIFSGADPSLANVSRKVINLAVQGLSVNLWDYSGMKQHTAEERASLILAHVPFVLFMSDVLGGKNERCSHLKRSPVAAAMARTYFKDADAASEFWREMRGGAKDPHPKSPKRLLEKYLLTSSVMSREVGKEAVDRREMFAKCILAWNAFRRKEPTVSLNFRAGTKIPKAV